MQVNSAFLTILLDRMVLFTPDYLVNLVKKLRVYVKVIMKQATQSRMFKCTCNQLYIARFSLFSGQGAVCLDGTPPVYYIHRGKYYTTIASYS